MSGPVVVDWMILSPARRAELGLSPVGLKWGGRGEVAKKVKKEKGK
jgi:hypothetical protein